MTVVRELAHLIFDVLLRYFDNMKTHSKHNRIRMKFGASIVSNFPEMDEEGVTLITKVARPKRSKRLIDSLPSAAEYLDSGLTISALSSDERLNRK